VLVHKGTLKIVDSARGSLVELPRFGPLGTRQQKATPKNGAIPVEDGGRMTSGNR